MSRLRTPPDSNSTSTETSQSSKKHQLRHRSPRGQRGRPRAGPGSPPPTTAQSHSNDGTTTSTRPRQRDRSSQVLPQQGQWDWAWKYRRELAGAAIAIVIVLVISAIRISLRTADYSSGAVYTPPSRALRPPSTVRNKPETSSLTSSIPSSSHGATYNRGESARKDKVGNDEADEKVLHEALDSAVRHALEDAWQLPPHAPASDGVAPAANAQEPAAGGGDDDSLPRQRTLAELYAELEDLGISPHELNEVLDEAMRSTGDR